MKRLGVVGVPGGWSSERLVDALAKKTGYRLLIDMQGLIFNVDKGTVLFQGEDVSHLDGLLIKKIGARYSPDFLDRLEILRFLSEKGLRIFSDPRSIMRVLDRLTCTVTMKLGGVPLPPTRITEDITEACRTVEEFGRAILKPLYTTKARGMMVLEAGPGVREKVEKYRKSGNPVMYIQKMLNLHEGRDLGVVFLGGKYLSTYARVGKKNQWNTTTHYGGCYRPYDPPREIIDTASQAHKLFGLDYTTVDVVETDLGPLVFEVSAFGGFRGLMESRGIEAAGLFVDYVLEQLNG